MPDITLLPVLADYFQVTVDQLLGLVPLNEEKYCNRNSKITEFFEKNPKAGYTFMKGQMISYGE